MNGGIHDAINLSEKLVKVWTGQADDRELDKYDAQRRPIAVDYVQQTTMRNKAMLEETDSETRKAKQDEMRRIVSDPGLAREYLMQSSMISALKRSATLG